MDGEKAGRASALLRERQGVDKGVGMLTARETVFPRKDTSIGFPTPNGQA